jgi:thiol:disulfide interchange protein
MISRRTYGVTRIALALLAVVAASPVTAQFGGKPKAKWTAQLVPADARAGEGAQVVLNARIDPDWHIYSLIPVKDGPIATTITLAKGSGALIPGGSAIQPAGKKEKDAGFGIVVELFEHEAAFGLPVKLAPKVGGQQKATVEVRFQACSGAICMPAVTSQVPVSFKVSPGAARPDHLKPIAAIPPQPGAKPGAKAVGAVVTPSGSGSDSSGGLASKGLFAFLWLSVLAGFGALLTPCVFPMIPITVSYFIKRKDQSKSGAAGPAAYCLGIIATFTGVGVITAAVFGASTIQRFANHPITNVVLAVIFLIMAANLFGVFEIVLPSSLVNKASSGTGKGGLVGPFLMGLTFALTSFTCTVAFVGTLLVVAAKGAFFYPVVGMAAFSTAFALPFFFLALFPGYLAKLPKSGSWMVSVKAFMGFLEIAAALKFLSNADLALSKGWLTRPVFLSVWAAVFVVAGLYLLGWLRLPHDADGLKPGWPRRALGVVTALLGLWFVSGINGQSLGQIDPYIPPDPYPGQESAAHAGSTPFLHKLSWAQAVAKSENRPIFINFTGANCTNCRQMERDVLPRPDVTKELASFIPVELYTDRPTPDDNANQGYQQKLTGAVTLPLYVVVTPDGRLLKKFDQGYTRNPAEFVAFLQDANRSATQVASR